MKLSEYIKDLRKRLGFSQQTLADKIGVSKSYISMLERGKNYRDENKKIKPNIEILNRIAELDGKTFDQMIGDLEDFEINISSITPPDRPTFRIPVLANVAAGIPIEAIEDIVDWEESNDLTGSEKDYFGLKVKGDSMEPRILNGDTLIVRKQPTADSGQTVVVLVNGDEGCVKKLKWTDSGMMLISNNTSYDPMFFTSDEIENLPVRIVGRVVEVRSKLI